MVVVERGRSAARALARETRLPDDVEVVPVMTLLAAEPERVRSRRGLRGGRPPVNFVLSREKNWSY